VLPWSLEDKLMSGILKIHDGDYRQPKIRLSLALGEHDLPEYSDHNVAKRLWPAKAIGVNWPTIPGWQVGR
jgi:hypothetical protein